ncbi:hypothetical protein ACWED2_26725 [Amycolatopsis sp. NPDC005003]
MKRTAVAFVVSVLSNGLFTFAVPGTANAVTYGAESTSWSGLHSCVTKPSQCSYGVIKFISSHHGRVKGKLDGYALRAGTKLHGDNLQKLYETCSASTGWRTGVAAVDAIILKKVKAAYTWFKAVIG